MVCLALLEPGFRSWTSLGEDRELLLGESGHLLLDSVYIGLVLVSLMLEVFSLLGYSLEA